MGYLFTVQFVFWLGRDRLWTRNSETTLLGLFGNTFWLALASCGSKFIYLIFLGFYTERVSVEKRFHTHFSFCESIFIYYDFLGASWGSSVLAQLLSTMKSSAPLRDCFLWGSVFPVKAMVSLCFCLK